MNTDEAGLQTVWSLRRPVTMCVTAAGSSWQCVNTGLNAALYAPPFLDRNVTFIALSCEVKLVSFSHLKALIPHHRLQNDLVYFTWTEANIK
jgi:hypothetical protein